MRDKFWIIDFVIDGERVLDLFNQQTADLARFLALHPRLRDHLDTRSMHLKNEEGGAE